MFEPTALSDQGGVAQVDAQCHREDWSVSGADAARASQLLRRLGQRPEPVVVLQRGEVTLTQVAPAAQPERASLLGEVHPARRPLLPANQGATSTALPPLRRQNPRQEPGALASRAGICAGRGAILVPTATNPPTLSIVGGTWPGRSVRMLTTASWRRAALMQCTIDRRISAP